MKPYENYEGQSQSIKTRLNLSGWKTGKSSREDRVVNVIRAKSAAIYSRTANTHSTPPWGTCVLVP